MLRIVAKSIIKDGEKDKYLELSKELIKKSRQEAGSISYNIFEDINNDSVLTFIEDWKDNEAIEYHRNTEHFKRIVPLLGEFKVSKSEVNIYKEV